MKYISAAPGAPLVALVGRPNVGKSTLFNRLVRRRQALMHDQPGVTRDRLYGAFLLEDPQNVPHALRLVDTGGLVAPGDDALAGAMMDQTHRAIKEAALVLLVVDAKAGLVPADADAARTLRRAGADFVVVANKVDIHLHEPLVDEFYRLGANKLIGVSAEHARNIDEIRDTVADILLQKGLLGDATRYDADAQAVGWRGEPAAVGVAAQAFDDVLDDDDAGVDGEALAALAGDPQGNNADAFDATFADAVQQPAVTDRVEWVGGTIRVAVVGRPNAGKSSLINALLGEERLVASTQAGTTRDVVDSACTVDGQEFVFLDTAGIRRQRSVTGRLEGLMVHMARASMERADVVVLVLDGTERPSDQDAKIAAMADERGCGLVFAANKWDLIENPEWREKFVPALRHDMPFVSYAPVVQVSAKTASGLSALGAAIVQTQRERHRRVGTGALNRFFRQVVDSHPPPVRAGARPQLQFVSQPMVRPPTFVVAAKRTQHLADSYRRYIINALRDRFGFAGTPLWLKFRAVPTRPRPGHGHKLQRSTLSRGQR